MHEPSGSLSQPIPRLDRTSSPIAIVHRVTLRLIVDLLLFLVEQQCRAGANPPAPPRGHKAAEIAVPGAPLVSIRQRE